MYLCASCIDFVSNYMYDFSIGFCNCSDSGIFCSLFYQYVVIKLRNSMKLIPLHIRINRFKPVTFYCKWSRFPTPHVHWGKADGRNCNYGHPKMADMKLGKNLFCRLNCFYNVF